MPESAPAAAARTSLNPVTAAGVCRPVVVPSPSWPAEFAPPARHRAVGENGAREEVADGE